MEMETFQRHAGGVMAINGGHFLRSRLAHEKGARVLLSGWGGDHCVSTYGDFYESELLKQGKWGAITRLFRAKQGRKRSGQPAKMWVWLLMKHLTPLLYRSIIRKRGGLESALWARADKHPLKPRFIERYRLCHELRRFTDTYQRGSVKAHHRRELFDVGVEGRLVESELCGRIYRMEYRYPILDVPLVELAYNMPAHLKIKDGIERYMFRHILEGVTTERIQWRAKADVNHPAFDRDGEARKRSTELLRELQQSKLANRYCNLAMLDQLIGDGMEGWMMLNRFRVLLDVERMVDSGEADIAEAD